MPKTATDKYSNTLIGCVMIGANIPHPEKNGLSYSRYEATCTKCDRQWTIRYSKVKDGLVGCYYQNPLRIGDRVRMQRRLEMTGKNSNR